LIATLELWRVLAVEDTWVFLRWWGEVKKLFLILLGIGCGSG